MTIVFVCEIQFPQRAFRGQDKVCCCRRLWIKRCCWLRRLSSYRLEKYWSRQVHNERKICWCYYRPKQTVNQPTQDLSLDCGRGYHRSDLAMEDMEASVPELKAWKSNLLSIPEYYHKSAVRTKKLKNFLPTMKAFPSYHNVRFSQHLNNVCLAVLHNQTGCLHHWSTVSADQDLDRGERHTSLMSDVCSVFQILQKHLQKICIILPDIMS